MEQTSPVKEGDIIAGKYRVERVLGVGGMGVVVAATHVNLKQRVALKFLLPDASKHPEVVERFAREARAAAGIQCDHVARVLDVDTLPTGAPYMVMEYMDGEDLEKVLERTGSLPVDLSVSYVLQACEALAEAHALGIVHRDLKPANLFLAKRPNGEPVVKVLDFGISKTSESNVVSNPRLTQSTAILGSPLYMSPEQMSSAKSADARSDVWAVGVVLYELLAGQPPFIHESMTGLVAAILQATPEPINELRPEVPEGLANAITRCLEKDAAFRFPNVAELAAAVAPFGPPRSAISVERICHVLGVRKPVSIVAATPSKKSPSAVGAGLAAPGADVSAVALSGPSSVSSPSPALAPDLIIPDLVPSPRSSPKGSSAKPPPSAVMTQAAPGPPVSRRGGSMPAISADFDDDLGSAGPDLKLDLAVPMGVPSGPVSRPPSGGTSSSSSGVSPVRAGSLDARFQATSARDATTRIQRTHESRRGPWLVLLFLLVATGGAAFAFGPTFLRSQVVDAAARRGVLLSAASVEPRSGGLLLSGVTLTLASVSDVAMKAPEVDLDVDWQGNVRKITLPGYELTIRGNVHDIAARYAAWRAAPHLPLAFEAKAGHLIWSDILPGVQLEGLDVATNGGSKEEGSLRADVASATLTFPAGAMGPWRAHLESVPAETSFTVTFDREKDDATPNLTLVARPTLGVVGTVAIPRSKVSRIGVPREFVPTATDPEVALALDGQIMPGGKPVKVHVTLSLFGATTPRTGPQPVDIVVDATFGGDPAKPLRIEPGSVTVGKLKGAIVGTVTFDHDGIRFDMDPAQPLPSMNPGKGQPPVPASVPALVFDTRDWTQSSKTPTVATAPSATPPAPSASASRRRH